MTISGVQDAGLMPGPAMTLANQVLGSGRNTTGRGCEERPSSPTSHAETAETNTPFAKPAETIASSAAPAISAPFASQMTAQVSRSTAPRAQRRAHP